MINPATTKTSTIDISTLTALTLAQKIDHTLLKVEAQETDILKLCQESVRYSFATVCIRSQWLPFAQQFFKTAHHTATKIITVVGFPTGFETSAQKLAETELALTRGAQEIDMVINGQDLKNQSYTNIFNEISSLVRLCETPSLTQAIPVKVIIESAALTTQQKIIATTLVSAAGAAFVKTSTGFDPAGGATLDDVKLLRAVASPLVQVKASGGIRDLPTALAMIQAGASRLGTSASVDIIEALIKNDFKTSSVQSNPSQY